MIVITRDDLLSALRRSIPAELAAAWLGEPNDHLEGKTPDEMLRDGCFASVISAAWLASGPGPVS